MKITTIFAVVGAAGLVAAAPTGHAEKSLAKRQIVYQNYYTCARSVNGVEKRVPCLPEDKAADEATTKTKRQIVYQNYYTCARSVNGVEKRVPCLPEDKAADAEATKTKRQIVYQNYYTCARSVDGIMKRVPCLPEDKATADEESKRWAAVELPAEAEAE